MHSGGIHSSPQEQASRRPWAAWNVKATAGGQWTLPPWVEPALVCSAARCGTAWKPISQTVIWGVWLPQKHGPGLSGSQGCGPDPGPGICSSRPAERCPAHSSPKLTPATGVVVTVTAVACYRHKGLDRGLWAWTGKMEIQPVFGPPCGVLAEFVFTCHVGSGPMGNFVPTASPSVQWAVTALRGPALLMQSMLSRPLQPTPRAKKAHS